MANTFVEYSGNGSTTEYNVPFPFIDRSHVLVYLNSVITTAFTWVNDGQISMNTAPASGAKLHILRKTPTPPFVDFTMKSRWQTEDLNLANRQAIYIAEEAADYANAEILALVESFAAAAEADANSAASSASSASTSASIATDAANAALSVSGVRDLESVTSLLANTTLTYSGSGVNTVSVGQVIRTRKEGFSYTVAASGASDHHVTTAGGVKLYVTPGNYGFNLRAFGAVPNDGSDCTVALQTAINATEANNGGAGGTLFIPNGSYRLTNKINLKGMVRMVGENYMSCTLYWDSTYTSGHCLELGPSILNGSFAFAARVENMSLSGMDVYRGLDKAMVYTIGAHQFSGLYNVFIRRFRSIGVHYDVGTNGPATFALHQVELQGSNTAPTVGSTIGLKCSAAGAVISAVDLLVQGSSTNAMLVGVWMLKDNLVLTGGHFEYCTTGITMSQNESTVRYNTISGVTGHSSVPTLVSTGVTTNLIYSLNNVSNVTTDTGISLNVLVDSKSGVTINGPTGGTAVTSYTSEAHRGGINHASHWARYIVGTGLGEKYNVSSVTVNTTGDYTFTLARPVKGTSACPIVQVRMPSGVPGFAVATVATSTTINVKTFNVAGTAADAGNIYLAVFSELN